MKKKKKFTPLYLDKQIKMVLKYFTYDEVRSGLESFSFEEWWDVKESLHKKIPLMNLDKLSLYDFKQVTCRLYGVEPDYDYLETVH